MPESHINNAQRVNTIGFTPSAYSADLTMDATGEALALATGVKKGAGQVYIVNNGATTEAIRVVFGTSETDALSNLTIVAGAATTGVYLPSNVDVPGGGIALLGVPGTATYVAVGPAVAGDTQTVAITQGV